MDMASVRAFMEKYASDALTDDVLDLVSGGTRDSAIAFLQQYCQGIPISRPYEE